MNRYEQLKNDLLQNFKDFQDIKHPGGSDAANEIVAEGLAKSIAREIDQGINLEFRGEQYVDYINRENKQPGYIYTVKNAGQLNGSSTLEVVSNTVVLWDGEKFKIVLRLIPTNYDQAIREFLSRFRIDGYLSSSSMNPVQNRVITDALNNEKANREAADAILQEQLDSIPSIYETKADAKAKVNNYGVGMRYQNYQTLKFYRPNI